MTLDFTGVFEKVASRRSSADATYHAVGTMYRTMKSPFHFENSAHWQRRAAQLNKAMENKFIKSPFSIPTDPNARKAFINRVDKYISDGVNRNRYWTKEQKDITLKATRNTYDI